MNAHISPNAQSLRITAVALGLLLALPGIAQQDDMQGMQMSHHPDLSKQCAKNAKNANGAKENDPLQPSSPRRWGSSDSCSEKPKTLDARLRGNDEQKMGAPAMQRTPASPSHDMHAMPKQSSEPVQLQHLDFGNMIGVRPKPGGLAEGSPDMQMNGMENMDMSSMQGGKAPPDARSPDYSDCYRYTDMPGMAMSDHSKQGMLLIDHLEYAHDIHGNNATFLDGEFWYGEDFNKLWVKAEGEYAKGKLEDLRTEALWYHATSAYWGAQLGVREDFGEGPNRTWAAFGVQGLAPYGFDTEATLYVSQSGRTAARFQFEYEERITQRLVLQPKFEVNLYGKDDPQRGIGSGLSDAELGVRLRYEFRREFAPYIGVVWRQRFGRTADLYRAQGEHDSDLQFVAGLHFWF